MTQDKNPHKLHITIIFFFFSLLCSYCVTEIIKKLELHLLVSKILILNLDMPKSVCPKLVHQCRKQPVRTLAHRSTFFCLVNVSCIFDIHPLKSNLFNHMPFIFFHLINFYPGCLNFHLHYI